MNYICKYCNRSYKIKNNHDKHVIVCEFYHKPIHEYAQERDSYEKIPSTAEMFNMIQYLALKCENLQKDVDRLKANNRINKKKVITEVLKKQSTESIISYNEFLQQLIISDDHLNSVFQLDLLSGMKKSLYDYIKTNNIEYIPIKAFSEKTNDIYIYTNENGQGRWVIWDNEMYDNWFKALSHKFLQRFLEWSELKRSVIESDDKIRENVIVYSQKILTNKKADKTELKKYIYTLINRKLITETL